MLLSYALSIGAIVCYYKCAQKILPSSGKRPNFMQLFAISLIVALIVSSIIFLFDLYFFGFLIDFFYALDFVLFLLSYIVCLWALIFIVLCQRAFTKIFQELQSEQDEILSRHEVSQEERMAFEGKRQEVDAKEVQLQKTNKELSKQQEAQLENEKKLDFRLVELENKEASFNTSKEQFENNQKVKKEQFFKELEIKFSIKEKELISSYEERLRAEKEGLLEGYNTKMLAFVESVTHKMEQRIYTDKKELLDDVFNFDGKEKDDFFEMKQLKESLIQEKEEIEKNRLLVEMEQKVSQANEHVVNAKSSALDIKSENVDLKSELKVLANEFTMGLTKEQLTREKAVDSVLHTLELEQERRKADYQKIGAQLQVMDAQTKAGLIELKSSLSHALKDLQLSTANSLREVRENVGDMKLQFGQEVLRLDCQQGQILTELEKYYVKNQQFVNQCQSLALEARSQNLNGQNMLQKVNQLYSQHKVDARDIESRLRTSMDQVSVKEGQLANSVGESMLKLKRISDEHYTTMKDMALEKKDINLLWKEKNSEHDRNLQEVKHQQQSLDMTRKLFNQEQSSFNQHKSSTMENARLTHRNYMQEQEYKMAMFKAEHSGGWLSRWAKRLEKNNLKPSSK